MVMRDDREKKKKYLDGYMILKLRGAISFQISKPYSSI